MISDDLRFARYLRARGNVALASDLVLTTLAETLAGDRETGWLEVELVGDNPEYLSRLSNVIVGRPFYRVARALGEASGRLRRPLLLQPILDVSNLKNAGLATEAISGALNAIMLRREPQDAVAIETHFLPPLRALRADHLTARVAAALAALGDQRGAAQLLEELDQNLESLNSSDRAVLQASFAPALLLLGESERAIALLDDSDRRLDSLFGDDIDGYGVPSFDSVAFSRAHALHLETWASGPWQPIPPVSSRFSSQWARFRPGRSEYEARKNAIEYYVETAVMSVPPDGTSIDAALTVIDDSRSDPDRSIGSLVRGLERWSQPLHVHALDQLIRVLAACSADDVADGAWTLAWLGHVTEAMELLDRVSSGYRRQQITTQAALWLATREETREEAIRLATQVATIDDHRTSALATRLLHSLKV